VQISLVRLAVTGMEVAAPSQCSRQSSTTWLDHRISRPRCRASLLPLPYRTVAGILPLGVRWVRTGQAHLPEERPELLRAGLKVVGSRVSAGREAGPRSAATRETGEGRDAMEGWRLRVREREERRSDGRNEMEELGFLHFYYEPSASQPSVLI
jgi:hypothetical protein